MSDLEAMEAVAAIKSGWITTGPRTKEFERKIADFCGVNRAVCLNSQTACAEMALRVLGVGEGDEVITSAYTYTASASVICHVGAKVVLIDTQPDSFEMDYDKLAAAINERTKAIIPVDLGGVPCDYERIFKIVEEKKALFRPASDVQAALGRIAVMADTAHAFGAKLGDRMIGSVADFSSFSFHAVKNLTTAEGGALTWRTIAGIDDEEIYKRLQLLSLHGQSKDALAKTKLGAWEYDVVGTYYKCNMTDIMAAIGLKQLERYPEMLIRRRELIEKYDAALKPLGVQTLPHYTDGATSSGHLYITRIPGITYEQRGEIIVRMAEAGIACNVHYKPLPMMTAYKKLGFDIADYPYAYFLITTLADGFDAGTERKRSKLYARLKEHFDIAVFDKSTDAHLISWLRRHFDKEGILADERVLCAMLFRVGHSMFMLNEEVTKLASYAKANGNSQISCEDVEEICSTSAESDAFAISNAIIEKNAEKAFLALGDMKQQRIEPPAVLAQLARTYSDLLSVSMLADEGMGSDDIAEIMKFHPYRLKLYMAAAKKTGTKKLAEALDRLIKIDAASKMGGVRGYKSVEMFIAQNI